MADVSTSKQVEALRSFFAKPQEFEERTTSEGHQIIIKYDTTSKSPPIRCEMSFLLPNGYPQACLRNVSVFCKEMSDEHLDMLLHDIEVKMDLWQGESMLLEFCCFVLERFEQYTDDYDGYLARTYNEHSPASDEMEDGQEISGHRQETPNAACHKEEDGKWQEFNMTDNSKNPKHGLPCEKNLSHLITSVLQLDHMRSKANYIKYIKKWTSELNLNGKLIFCKRYIFIVLQGKRADVKDYIVKNKTVNVDVDSRGRSCKERLLNTLCEVPVQDHTIFTDFAVIDDVPSTDALSSLFESFLMKDLFEEYIAPGLSIRPKRQCKK